MKKLTALILKVSLVLSGLIIITNHVGATKRDVETALSLIQQARTAIGGDSALGSVQSLSMKGTSIRTFQLEGEADRPINGEFELALVRPNGIFRIEKFGAHDGAGQVEKSAQHDRIIRIETPHKIKIDEGDAAEVRMSPPRHNNDFTRYMIGLLLTAPENVTYDYAGDGNVDGTRADVIVVTGQGGAVMKLFLDKQSHLPLMMSHQGYDLPPMMAIRTKAPANGEGKVIVRQGAGGEVLTEDIIVEHGGQLPAGANGNVMIFKREGKEGVEAPETFRMKVPAPKEAEIQVRFADYRPVNGIMLPHRLTQTINGRQSQVMTVSTYEINSPATAEKFGPGKIRFVHKGQD